MIATTQTSSATTQGNSSISTLPVVEAVVSEKNDERIILDVPHTDYKIYLKPKGTINAKIGDYVTGVIRASALKVISINAGGRYVEPAYGRPRRVQGAIVGGDVNKNQVWVNAGVPIVVTLIDTQKASDFGIGQMLSFDVKAGATFEQVEQ